jgi:hypothetical protein
VKTNRAADLVLGYKWAFLEHYMEHGQTVNSERYSTMLKDKLKPAIRSKWRGLLWLCNQRKTFFCDGIKKLIESCKKCVDKQRDYVEK